MAELIELRNKGVSWNNLSIIYGVDVRILQRQAIGALALGKEYFKNDTKRKAIDKKLLFMRKLGFSLVSVYEHETMYGVLSRDAVALRGRAASNRRKQQIEAKREVRRF